jgi:hypothetical protein
MSENRDFEQQLRSMASDAARQSRLGSPADIRRRAVRRRALQVSATAVATVLVVAGAWAVAAPGGDDAGTGPAGPSTSTPTTPEDGTGTGTVSTTEPSHPGQDTTSTGPELPPQQPGPTGGPPPSAIAAVEPPAGGWVTTLPENSAIVLPHWIAKGEFEEEGAWQQLRGVDTWLLTPCDATEGSGYPSDASRSAHAVIGQSNAESFQAEQVAVYPSDVEAMRALGELIQALMDCQAERTVRDGEDALSRTYTDSYWGWADAVETVSAGDTAPDEAFQAWNWNRTYLWDGSPQYGLGGGFYTVVRVGNAILLTMRDGETDWGAPGAAEEVSVAEAKTARGVVPALCERYAGADGC